MIDIRKLEEKEVVFINKKPTEKEDLDFSNFLKERKLKNKNNRKRVEKKKI